MSMFIQNLLYSVLLIVSGMIILATLSHFRMKVARGLFLVLFAVSLVYIPFYFGGSAMTSFFSGMFKDRTVADTFISTMQQTLTAPFLLFRSVTLGMALFSIIVTVAGLIATVTLAVRVIKYVRNCLKKAHFAPKPFRFILLNEDFLYINYRFLYKRLERYRN